MSRNRNKNRAVAISKLAMFAADPEAFERTGGAPASLAAANYGERWHARLGKGSALLLRILALLALVAVAAWLLK